MTDPELTPNVERPLVEPSITKAEADQVMEGVYFSMPTRAAQKRLRGLYEQAGAPLAAYLGFEGVDPTAEDIERQFYGSYLGSYSRDELIDLTIEMFELDVRLERFLEESALPPAALDWNLDAMWPKVAASHYLVQEGDVFHVFVR